MLQQLRRKAEDELVEFTDIKFTPEQNATLIKRVEEEVGVQADETIMRAYQTGAEDVSRLVMFAIENGKSLDHLFSASGALVRNVISARRQIENGK